MAPKKPTTRTIHRSSKTGRIVSAKYAKTHPTTTETERVTGLPTKTKEIELDRNKKSDGGG